MWPVLQRALGHFKWFGIGVTLIVIAFGMWTPFEAHPGVILKLSGFEVLGLLIFCLGAISVLTGVVVELSNHRVAILMENAAPAEPAPTRVTSMPISVESESNVVAKPEATPTPIRSAPVPPSTNSQRIPLDLTPAQIRAKFVGVMWDEGQRRIQPLLNKWPVWTLTVKNRVSPSDIFTYVRGESTDSDDPQTVWVNFRTAYWIGKAQSLEQDQMVTVTGRLLEVNQSSIELEECELVEDILVKQHQP